MTDLVFLTPYEAQKLLSGVIPANRTVRPNWLQTFFGNVTTTDRDTVNFDVEYQAKNTIGMFVDPGADVTPITLKNFGSKQLTFSYAKEGLNSPDYEEINGRQLGQPFGNVDIMANEAANIRAKLALAEQRFENLFEWVASQIIFYGGYTASSEKHRTVVYDFGRTTITTESDLNNGLVPEADLTTINAGGGVGNRRWGQANGTPVADLVTMYETASFRAGARICVMAENAYTEFNDDVVANYKDAATLTLDVMMRAQLDVLPIARQYQGLTYRRSWPLGNGEMIDIYTYNATYNTRSAGTLTKFVPDGYVALLPPPENGIKVYGKIMHPRAQYQAMPRWINTWEEEKTGKREWEVHTNFVMGHTDIDSLVCWKVM